MKTPNKMLVFMLLTIGYAVVFAQDVDLVKPKIPLLKTPPVKVFIPKEVVTEAQPEEFVCPTPSSGSVYPRVVFRLAHQIRIPSGQTQGVDIVYTVPKTCILVIETVTVLEVSSVNAWVQVGLYIRPPGGQPGENLNMNIPFDRSDRYPGPNYTSIRNLSFRQVRIYALPGDQVSLGVNHYPNVISAGPLFTIHGYLLHHESPSIGP